MKSQYTKYASVIFVFLCLLVFLPIMTHATTAPTTYTSLAPLPNLTTNQLAPTTDFQTYVTNTFNLLIALGAVAAVFMITWGGFEYMTSDAVQSKSDGVTKIKNAIYGLLLILSSYLILQTIDPRFVHISSTLVTPLGVTSSNNALSSTNANSVETSIQNQQATVAGDQAAAQNSINTAQQQLTNAQAAGDTSAVNAAQNQLNIANASKAVADYNAAILNMNPTMGLGAFSSAETAAYNTAIQTISTSAASNPSAVNALYHTDAQIQQLIRTQLANTQGNTAQLQQATIEAAQNVTRGLLQDFQAQ